MNIGWITWENINKNYLLLLNNLMLLLLLFRHWTIRLLDFLCQPCFRRLEKALIGRLLFIWLIIIGSLMFVWVGKSILTFRVIMISLLELEELCRYLIMLNIRIGLFCMKIIGQALCKILTIIHVQEKTIIILEEDWVASLKYKKLKYLELKFE